MKRSWLLVSGAASLWLLSLSAWAQCALCKAAVESAQDPNLLGGLKIGILFLLGLPYVLVSFIGFLLIRTSRKRKAGSGRLRNDLA